MSLGRIRRSILRRRKMFKKLFAITLALIFCLALFTGCGATKTSTDQAVLSVTVSPDAVSMATTKGSSSQLTATVEVAGGAAQTVSWTSSDTSAVEVDKNGKVSVVRYAALGSYIITATSTVDSSIMGTAIITLK
jgi:uncharacterized protein YjdB